MKRTLILTLLAISTTSFAQEIPSDGYLNTNDFKNVADHLVKGGFILLDDSADHMNYGSSKMMEIIKKDKRFKIVSKKPNYLLQKIG